MYEFGTKLDTEKREGKGLSQLIRFYPPNLPDSRSIFGLQKNGTDAETFAETRAVIRAVPRAERFAVVRAEIFAERVQILVQKTAQMLMQNSVQYLVQKKRLMEIKAS